MQYSWLLHIKKKVVDSLHYTLVNKELAYKIKFDFCTSIQNFLQQTHLKCQLFRQIINEKNGNMD